MRKSVTSVDEQLDRKAGRELYFTSEKLKTVESDPLSHFHAGM